MTRIKCLLGHDEGYAVVESWRCGDCGMEDETLGYKQPGVPNTPLPAEVCIGCLRGPSACRRCFSPHVLYAVPA